MFQSLINFRSIKRVAPRRPSLPFLFMLVGYMFSYLFSKGINQNLLKSFEVGRDGVEVSHLEYADDKSVSSRQIKAGIHNFNTIEFFQKISKMNVKLAKSNLELEFQQRKVGIMQIFWGVNGENG